MQSIIIISEKQIDMTSIAERWASKSITTNMINSRLVIELENGRIYVDLIEDGISEYNEDELAALNMANHYFYSVSYTDYSVLKRFINETPFNGRIYTDDDMGNITTLQEFCKQNNNN
jgi:hypothetical protein